MMTGEGEISDHVLDASRIQLERGRGVMLHAFSGWLDSQVASSRSPKVNHSRIRAKEAWPPIFRLRSRVDLRRFQMNVAMSSRSRLLIAGTVADSAGYPTTRIRNGRSCGGRPRSSLRNPIGLGVCVRDASPA